MAYARGLVAGFEIHNMDDLISFSDAFGASRLRYELVTSKVNSMLLSFLSLWFVSLICIFIIYKEVLSSHSSKWTSDTLVQQTNICYVF